MRSIIPENLVTQSLVVFEKKAGQEKPEIGRFFKPEVTDQKFRSPLKTEDLKKEKET